MDSKYPNTPSPSPTPLATPLSTPASQFPGNEHARVAARPSRGPVILLALLCIALGVGLFVLLCVNLFSAASSLGPVANIEESHHSGDMYAQKKVAIISVTGVMLEGNGFTKKQIDRVRDDEDVEAIVLRVNSPGGAVTAADYLYHHLKELRDDRNLPIVVSMGPMAASGGYYVAMAASDEERVIFCEPTGMTGSIGVIMPRYDISGLLEDYNVKSDAIVSHPYKELGSWTKNLDEKDRPRLQAQIDLLFNRFKDIVREGRPHFANDDEALDQVATGEVFTGLEAKELMLVDEVGFIEEAIERAAELGNLSKGNYQVVQYDRSPTLMDALTGSVEAPSHPLDTKQLLEMSTPRAYYLYSWLPGFVPR